MSSTHTAPLLLGLTLLLAGLTVLGCTARRRS